jgi:hypothetical protein
MAWTAPMTAIANSVFTAAQYNTHVRDNLLETAPAKATTGARLIVTTGLNSVAERVVSESFVVTAETTTSTSYDDLATVGPTVTVTTGSAALTILSVRMGNSTAAYCLASVQVSGASSVAAADARSLRYLSATGGNEHRGSVSSLFTGLTPGSNTFTAKYLVRPSGTGTFQERRLTVIAL